MKTNLYPDNWLDISYKVKFRSQFMCEVCGADCYEERPVNRQNLLTVHHIDHNPGNCHPSNLIALCAVCHLRADAQWHARNAAITRNAKVRGPMLPLPMQM
jgi:5-methylcytosine-specific restriction endonuclease McrA